jgi:hypothetical protein
MSMKIILAILLLANVSMAGDSFLVKRNVKISSVQCYSRNLQTPGSLKISGVSVESGKDTLQILADPAETDTLCPTLQTFEKAGTAIDVIYVVSAKGIPFMRGFLSGSEGYLTF